MRHVHLIIYIIFLFFSLAIAEENLDLFKIAQEGNAEQIKELIDSGIDLSKKDANGRNALMHAVIFGNKETVLELLKEFKQLEKKDVQGMNPLALSLRYGDSEITKILLEH